MFATKSQQVNDFVHAGNFIFLYRPKKKKTKLRYTLMQNVGQIVKAI